MKKILFVCLGNICRSPMAEFVFRDLVKKADRESEFYIASAATSSEEVGSPVHIGTRRILNSLGIDCSFKRAVQLVKNDYDKYDYIIGMESRNCKTMLKIFGSDKNNKIYRLCDFTSNPRDIADPWYTGNFELTYQDILDGCQALLDKI